MCAASAAWLWWSSTFPLLVLSVVYFVASVLVFRKRLQVIIRFWFVGKATGNSKIRSFSLRSSC
ncbi:MAG: hypothetical protein MZV70_17415 [Desulfobacterales bacterium]|nr:hypothetical protein [Desulfobacterales bacterium]